MKSTMTEHSDHRVSLSNADWWSLFAALFVGSVVAIGGGIVGQAWLFQGRMTSAETMIASHEKRLDENDDARDRLRTEILNELKDLRRDLKQ